MAAAEAAATTTHRGADFYDDDEDDVYSTSRYTDSSRPGTDNRGVYFPTSDAEDIRNSALVYDEYPMTNARHSHTTSFEGKQGETFDPYGIPTMGTNYDYPQRSPPPTQLRFRSPEHPHGDLLDAAGIRTISPTFGGRPPSESYAKHYAPGAKYTPPETPHSEDRPRSQEGEIGRSSTVDESHEPRVLKVANE